MNKIDLFLSKGCDFSKQEFTEVSDILLHLPNDKSEAIMANYETLKEWCLFDKEKYRSVIDLLQEKISVPALQSAQQKFASTADPETTFNPYCSVVKENNYVLNDIRMFVSGEDKGEIPSVIATIIGDAYVNRLYKYASYSDFTLKVHRGLTMGVSIVYGLLKAAAYAKAQSATLAVSSIPLLTATAIKIKTALLATAYSLYLIPVAAVGMASFSITKAVILNTAVPEFSMIQDEIIKRLDLNVACGFITSDERDLLMKSLSSKLVAFYKAHDLPMDSNILMTTIREITPDSLERLVAEKERTDLYATGGLAAAAIAAASAIWLKRFSETDSFVLEKQEEPKNQIYTPYKKEFF